MISKVVALIMMVLVVVIALGGFKPVYNRVTSTIIEYIPVLEREPTVAEAGAFAEQQSRIKEFYKFANALEAVSETTILDRACLDYIDVPPEEFFEGYQIYMQRTEEGSEIVLEKDQRTSEGGETQMELASRDIQGLCLLSLDQASGPRPGKIVTNTIWGDEKTSLRDSDSFTGLHSYKVFENSRVEEPNRVGDSRDQLIDRLEALHMDYRDGMFNGVEDTGVTVEDLDSFGRPHLIDEPLILRGTSTVQEWEWFPSSTFLQSNDGTTIVAPNMNGETKMPVVHMGLGEVCMFTAAPDGQHPNSVLVSEYLDEDFGEDDAYYLKKPYYFFADEETFVESGYEPTLDDWDEIWLQPSAKTLLDAYPEMRCRT